MNHVLTNLLKRGVVLAEPGFKKSDEPEFEHVTKAVAPDLEHVEMPFGFPFDMTEEEFEQGMRHDDERAGYEARLLVFLLDRGWSDEGRSDCVLVDTFLHPSSPHSAKTGAELARLLDFEPDVEDALQRLLRRARRTT